MEQNQQPQTTELTITDIVKDLNIARTVVSNWITSGQLPSSRTEHGGKRKLYIVDPKVYAEFLNTNETAKRIVEENRRIAETPDDSLISTADIIRQYKILNPRSVELLVSRGEIVPFTEGADAFISWTRFRKSDIDKVVAKYQEEVNRARAEKEEAERNDHRKETWVKKMKDQKKIRDRLKVETEPNIDESRPEFQTESEVSDGDSETIRKLKLRISILERDNQILKRKVWNLKKAVKVLSKGY